MKAPKFINTLSESKLRSLNAEFWLTIVVIGALSLLSACDLFTDREVYAHKDKTTSVHLLRAFQKVDRYNCQGALTSSKEEEVVRANALVWVYPDARTSQIYSSSFYNRSTLAGNGAIRDNTGFYVDISAHAALGMHVQVGINNIDYHLTECLKKSWNADHSYEICDDERTLEDGSIQLEVSFEEQHLDGTREYRESCPPPPTQNP